MATILFGEGGAADLDELINEMQVEIVPVTADHACLARQAFAAFGKGRHPARLNFGDCFAYALAKASGHVLLFKGNDFSRTDVEVAPRAREERHTEALSNGHHRSTVAPARCAGEASEM